VARVSLIVILFGASLMAAPPYTITSTPSPTNTAMLNAMLWELYSRTDTGLQLAPDGAAVPGLAVESTDSRLRRLTLGMWDDIYCVNLYADDKVVSRRGLFGGYVDPSTDTLRVRGSSFFDGIVQVDSRLGVGVAPQADNMISVSQFSVPYAWRVNTNSDVATNLYGIGCAGAWGQSGIFASNSYTPGYDIWGNSAGIGSVGIYTPLISPRKSGVDTYIRISTAVAIDPHGDITGTTVGLLDLRNNNKSTALYIEGSTTGITIASGRTAGILDYATYSRHGGYLLVGEYVSSGLSLHSSGTVRAAGNMHVTGSGSVGYWIDASTSFRWGMYRDESHNLAFRGNDAATAGLSVCPSSVVVHVPLSAAMHSKVYAYKSGGSPQQISSGSYQAGVFEGTSLLLNAVAIDTLGEYSMSHSSFVATYAGYYTAVAHVEYSGTTAGHEYYLDIQHNLAPIARDVKTCSDRDTFINLTTVAPIFWLNAGDRVRPVLWHTNTTDEELVTSRADTYFSIYRIP